MGKRKRAAQEKENEDLRKRIKRLEKQMEKQRNEETPVTSGSPGTPPLPDRPEEIILTEDDIPEDLIQALGKEGECKEIMGEELQQQLVTRWTNIIHQGLGKETREQLVKKYPTPANFSEAVPPIMNEEIGATMSETSTKRDKRIMYRQMLVSKVMFSLGKALTNILKGNLNTKELVEQINDSAKFAAEVYYQDSSSRKFFALAGATPLVKEAIKSSKTDSYLFGKNCGEKIKAAQTIQKTGSQIKAGEFRQKRQENWRSPLQPHTQYRSGPAHRQQVKSRATQPAQRTQPTAMRKKPMQTQKPPQPRHRRY